MFTSLGQTDETSVMIKIKKKELKKTFLLISDFEEIVYALF
jgi:hypothetical protein